MTLFKSLLFLSLLCFSSFAEETVFETTLTKISPNHSVALARNTTELSFDDKVKAIKSLLKLASTEKPLHIIIDINPNIKSDFAVNFTNAVKADVEKAVKRGVDVQFIAIDFQAAEKLQETLNILSKQNTNVEQKNDIFFAQNISKEDLNKFNLSTWTPKEKARQTLMTAYEASKNIIHNKASFAVSSLVALGATGLQFNTLGPSYAYVSNGTFDLNAAASFALSVAVLQGLSGTGKVRIAAYETLNEFFRIGIKWLKFVNQDSILAPKKNSIKRMAYISGGAFLATMSLQEVLFSFTQGPELWTLKTQAFIASNSAFWTLASTPFTFLTEKIVQQTNLSEIPLKIFRTSHLLALGAVAASRSFGPEVSYFDVSYLGMMNMGEVAAILMGAGAIALNFKSKSLIDAINRRIEDPNSKFRIFKKWSSAPVTKSCKFFLK